MPSILNATTVNGIAVSGDNSGVLALQTNNGTTAVTIDTSQNVGVGTTSPSSFAGKLVVNGGVSLLNSNRLYLWSPSNGFAPAIYAPSESIAFTDNNGVETFRVGSTGVLTLKGGNNAASGVGITFPATQSASSDANCLDDYEEGTWTPTIRGSGTAGTYTLSDTRAYYTKIGNQVTLYASFGFNAASGGTGYMQIGGIPFSYKANSALCGAVLTSNFNLISSSAATLTIVSTTSSSATTIYIAESVDNAAVNDAPISGVSTSTFLLFSVNYTVS